MKNRLHKQFALLVFPALALLMLGFFFINTGPALEFQSSQVKSVSFVKKRPTLGQTDTRVIVFIKHNPRSPFQRFPDDTFYIDGYGNHIEDENGTIYGGYDKQNTVLRWHDGSRRGIGNTLVEYIGENRYSVTYELPLSQIPKSAGKLFLKTIIKIEGVGNLPITISVRPKK